MSADRDVDILIVGGGVGGVAAALAASIPGVRVMLTEELPWLGGQLTSQGVPPDEHPWIERLALQDSYHAYRNRVRAAYRDRPGLTSAARTDPYLNPGQARISRISHEPSVSAAVLTEMLAPAVDGGILEVRHGVAPVGVAVEGDRVRAVHFSDGSSVTATIVLDATEEGDVLALAGAEYSLGAESRDETGESLASDVADPLDQQAFTWCLAVEHRPGEHHVIDRPDDYAFWRDLTPSGWTGKLLSMTWPHPPTLQPRTTPLLPAESQDGEWNLWEYRRIRFGGHYAPGVTDVSVINWPQNDYFLGAIVDAAPEERARHLRSAKNLSLSFLYWLQTEAPRWDGGTGYPELAPWHGLGGDAGLALAPYIREGRRLKAKTTIRQHDVDAETRAPLGGSTVYADSVGTGSYHVDLHPSASGRLYVDFESLPFEIPLGALVPIRITNLVASSKNIGTTHLANGCYRLHTVEWSIGEAAGTLGAYCAGRRTEPAAVVDSPAAVEDVQRRLEARGVQLHWPRDTVEEAIARVHSPKNAVSSTAK